MRVITLGIPLNQNTSTINKIMIQNCVVVESRWRSQSVNVQHARESVREVLRTVSDPEEAGLIELAVGEACANAVEHGSPAGERNEFVLRCRLVPPCMPEHPKNGSALQLVLEVEDEGRNTEPSDIPLNGTPDLLAERGRGLFMICQIMDDVSVCRSLRGVTLRMTKDLPASRFLTLTGLARGAKAECACSF
jgi:anti-sigma regulatory factor (Ser/Thr protein kinase)